MRSMHLLWILLFKQEIDRNGGISSGRNEDSRLSYKSIMYMWTYVLVRKLLVWDEECNVSNNLVEVALWSLKLL